MSGTVTGVTRFRVRPRTRTHSGYAEYLSHLSREALTCADTTDPPRPTNQKRNPPMTLDIDPEDVARVLIAGEWYAVALRSFDLGAHEYVTEEGYTYPIGGTHPDPPRAGFAFTYGDRRIVGPLTSVQAVEVFL